MTTSATAPKDWKGTFAILQDRPIAEILSRHSRLEILDQDGLLVLMAKNRFFGYTEGIVGSPEVDGEFAQWWQKIKDINCSFLTIHTTGKLDHLTPYRITPEDNHNMILDLSRGEEALFNDFNRSCQRAIRAGIKKGVVMREATGADDFEKFYQIILQVSQEGRKFELLSREICQELLQAGCARIFLAIGEHTVVAAELYILSHNTMYGWMGSVDRNFVHLSPGNLLMFECMKWGIANGYRFYDLGQQSLSHNPGIVSFKKSFSPILTPAYSYYVPRTKYKVLFSKLKKIIKKR
jgi:lipid II:glycine glycyltransferase (peptidoglycan interpeptide bridge formation enzyme)